MFKKLMIILSALTATECGKGFDSVDAAEFADFIKDPEVQLIDTRTPQEYSEGHIPGAVLIDFYDEDFLEQIDRLDRNRPVAVYCRSGRRSKIAAERFVSKGFKVTELNGGIISWKGKIE